MTPHTAKKLHDAISACDELQTYTADWTRDEFLYTRSLQLIVWKLIDIMEETLREAEASQPTLRAIVPEIDDAMNTVNRSTQRFGDVDFAQLWDLVKEETPALRQKLAFVKSEALDQPVPVVV